MSIRLIRDVPNVPRKQKHRQKYGWHRLDVNDVMHFDNDDEFERARRAAAAFARNNDLVFTSRKGFAVDENKDVVWIGKGGLIWRREGPSDEAFVPRQRRSSPDNSIEEGA